MVSGHADSGESGHDLVCAAVSALVETLALGLRQLAGIEGGQQVEEGRAEFKFGDDAGPIAEISVRLILGGLLDLAQSHGRFIRVRRVDVA
jgi:hypothetical protein